MYFFFQHVFLEFVKIEMIFHAKALELYSKAHNVLKAIHVEEDLHVRFVTQIYLTLLYDIHKI